MNIITFIIIIVVFLCAIIYMALKRGKINAMNKSIQDKNPEALGTLLNQSLTQKLLSSYVLDLYKATQLRIVQDYDGLKEHIMYMNGCLYQENEVKQYLTLYFHFFMIRQDYAFCYELLDTIHKVSDVPFAQYCDWTYLVLANQKSDYIHEMNENIEVKRYSGFELAVITYLIGVQYEYKGEMDAATEWYHTALSVSQPRDLYVKQIKEKLNIE